MRDASPLTLITLKSLEDQANDQVIGNIEEASCIGTMLAGIFQLDFSKFASLCELLQCLV
jgi:hypothetical protein